MFTLSFRTFFALEKLGIFEAGLLLFTKDSLIKGQIVLIVLFNCFLQNGHNIGETLYCRIVVFGSLF